MSQQPALPGAKMGLLFDRSTCSNSLSPRRSRPIQVGATGQPWVRLDEFGSMSLALPTARLRREPGGAARLIQRVGPEIRPGGFIRVG